MYCKRLHIDAAIGELNQALTTCFIEHGVDTLVITKVRLLVLTLEGERWGFTITYKFTFYVILHSNLNLYADYEDT